jgi:hypothetical protein
MGGCAAKRVLTGKRREESSTVGSEGNIHTGIF